MTQRLVINYGLNVDKETVREFLKTLDLMVLLRDLSIGSGEGSTQPKVQITCGISMDMTN